MSDQPTDEPTALEFLAARLADEPIDQPDIDEIVGHLAAAVDLKWSTGDADAWVDAYREVVDLRPDDALAGASAFIATAMEVGRRNPAPAATAPIPSTAEYDQPPPAEPVDEPDDEPATHVLAEPYTGPWIGVGDDQAPKPEPET